MAKPIIGLTIGDPAGIGPEICLRAVTTPEVMDACRPVLIGSACALERARVFLGFQGRIDICAEDDDRGMAKLADTPAVTVVDTKSLSTPPPLGQASAEGGQASYDAIEASIRLAQEGRVAGVATAPINKLALSMAGIDYLGHTEIFGERTNTTSYAMLMYSGRVAVGLVTCHIPLSAVPRALTVERIVEVGMLLDSAITRIRGVRPRIAALGLNPHAGEAGLLGDDEKITVIPAVEKLRELGLDIEGPVPPDTAFTRRAIERYDAHLCLYHDQGLIPFKMISFEDGVNVTMGLPFPRTSVDHGTAYDLAGKGTADHRSLVAALKLAAKLAQKEG